MMLTIIFIHEGEVIKLQIAYSPDLDRADQEGVWDLESNCVAMSWRLYSEFTKEKSIPKRAAMLEDCLKVSRVEMR